MHLSDFGHTLTKNGFQGLSIKGLMPAVGTGDSRTRDEFLLEKKQSMEKNHLSNQRGV